MAEGIVAGCEEQQRLIEALLDLTRSQRGLTRQEPVDIAAITREALREHEIDGFECGLALEPAMTGGDPILLERLTANLISNAIRHNIANGRIDIATRTDGRRAVLSVTNSGPFIRAEEVTRLFEPFEQLDAHRRVGDIGVGLGLAIVQAIADAHGATVAARARASGGLEIEVRFPELGSTSSPHYDARMSSPRVPGGVVHRLPADLREALVANATALDAWKDITPLARNEFICWVEDAKQQKTRERRIRRTQEELEDGMRRPCCWPGCKHRERNGR